MARKPTRGRRAAPQSGGSSGGPTDFTFGAGKTPELVAPGSYDVQVLGARSITYGKSGATAVELTLETIEDGKVIDLDTLLVNSLGGTSRMIDRNRGMLRDLVDTDDDADVSFSELMDLLNRGSIKAEVSVYLGTTMDGAPVNKLASVDAILTDDEEAA